MKSNKQLVLDAISDVFEQAEKLPQSARGLSRVTAGLYTNKDGETHVHASGSITIKLYATKEGKSERAMRNGYSFAEDDKI
jgi:hypothetical protein